MFGTGAGVGDGDTAGDAAGDPDAAGEGDGDAIVCAIPGAAHTDVNKRTSATLDKTEVVTPAFCFLMDKHYPITMASAFD